MYEAKLPQRQTISLEQSVLNVNILLNQFSKQQTTNQMFLSWQEQTDPSLSMSSYVSFLN